MKWLIRGALLITLLIGLGIPTVWGAVCDVDNDNDIDRNDINLITTARNTPASGADDPRDANADGNITVNDARQCVLQCTLPRCTIIDTPLQAPAIEVSPRLLDFGEVFVGNSTIQTLTVDNTGAAILDIESIVSSNPAFTVFPPTSFSIEADETPRTVTIGFSPTSFDSIPGTITFSSNAVNEDPLLVEVRGTGVQSPNLVPDISTLSDLEFGDVEEGVTVEMSLPVTNLGDAPLNISAVSTDNPVFEVLTSIGGQFPLIVDPNQSRNLVVRMITPVGSVGTVLTGLLTIESNDPDEGVTQVSLRGNGLLLPEEQHNNPVLGARVQFEDPSGQVIHDLITAETCVSVGGEVEFNADANGTDSFYVVLTDQHGQPATSGLSIVSNAAGTVTFSGIDACALADGIIAVSIVVNQNGNDLPAVPGTPAAMNTSTFPAPVLDPLPEVTLFSTIEVCGASRQSTTVRIEGGARIVSTQLDANTSRFCLDVPLRSNTQNTLLASAIDDLDTPPKQVAYAAQVSIVHVDPSEILFADVFARPLTESEIADLIGRDIINLDDPENFDVFMFTVVLTIGGKEVRIEEPVPVSRNPGSVGYGGGGGSRGGWSGGSGGWSGGRSSLPSAPTSSGGCITGCAQIVIIRPPSGPVIPGVIIIDGRIKTLKEFFQVTIVIGNTSDSFVLSDMQAAIELPPGLSPVRAGPGTEVSEVNAAGEIDQVTIGEIGPHQTGAGQFIIRGDAVGTHGLEVNFQGFITSGGIPDPIPVGGSAGTTVQVYGPPKLGVVVRHPSDPDGHDVVAGEIYPLTVEITNFSNRPALYTSLELFAGGSAELLDENDQPIAGSSEVKDFGIIPPGRTTSATFRMRSSAQGEIIACQGIAGENIVLTVDIGPESSACNLVNTTPAPFLPLQGDLPPTLIGINPLNGQANIPLTSSVIAILTPPSACLVADTWANVSTAPVDPTDVTRGQQIVAADLVKPGTFYLEELDALGQQPIRHIPVELITEDPPAGGTTIAVLRLGLGNPLTQYFLEPNTRYRVTLVGADREGDSAVCNAGNGVPLAQTFQWTFSTAQVCDGIDPPTATLLRPEDGSSDRPLNQVIVLDLKNRIDPTSIINNPLDPSQNSFSVYQNAMEVGGDVEGGTLVPGKAKFDSLTRVLTYTPLSNLDVDSTIHIRLQNSLRDVCGNPLETPANGVKLLSFQTISPDITPPDAPQVNPVPRLTNKDRIQISGSAEANSEVSVSGGVTPVSTTASESGRFSVLVPLNLNSANPLEIQAVDASGNASPPTTNDNAGSLLTVINDSLPPEVASVDPLDGGVGVSRGISVIVNFNEPFNPSTVDERNITLSSSGVDISGSVTVTGESTFTFTPDVLLEHETPHTLRLRANGIEDLAGNGLPLEYQMSFITEVFPLPVIDSVLPDQTIQGSILIVTISGSNLATANEMISDNQGVMGTILSASDTTVEAEISVDIFAPIGPASLGLATLGGGVTVPFTIVQKPPVISALTPNAGALGTSVTAELRGSGLVDVSDITSDCEGLVVTDLGTGDDTRLPVGIAVDAATTVQDCTVTVTTSGGTASTMFSVLPAALVLIEVLPVNQTIPLGTQQQFTATGTFTDGLTRDLTQEVSWGSDNTAVAIVSNDIDSEGVATSTGLGSTIIMATEIATGVSASVTLNVTQSILVSLSIVPVSPTIFLGTSLQFTITGTFTDGRTENFTEQVTWSANDTNVAIVSNEEGIKGVITGTGVGTTAILAMDAATGLSDATTVTVAPSATVVITTDTGNGADAFVYSRSSGNFGASDVIAIKRDTALSGNNRKGYLRFDITSITQSISDISLELTYVGKTPDTSANPSTYRVYGLLDGHIGENWGELAINWSNAPGNNTSSTIGVLPDETELLGTFALSFPGTSVGDKVIFASDTLRDFVQADTDGMVTFIVVREQANFAIEYFTSKEHSTLSHPILNVVTSGGGSMDWTQRAAAASFPGRYGHQVAVLNGQLWLIGGSGDSGFMNDIWSSPDGVNWTQEASSAPFSARRDHQVVAFNNRLWLIGGVDGPLSNRSDIWSSSDGVNWTQETIAADFPGRYGHEVVAFNNQLWLIAGSGDNGFMNNIWSSPDGVNWTQEASSAPFSARRDHQVVTFNNKLWLIGGVDEFLSNRNDIWSSTDGLNWTQEITAADFPGRYGHEVVAFNNQLWLIAGSGDNGFMNNIWSSPDGVNWTQEASLAPFSARRDHQVVTFNGGLWLIGGVDGPFSNKSDIWSFNLQLGGTLIVANDEWTLSNTGFSSAPDVERFVRNIATLFSGGTGSFHAYSTNFSLTESRLKTTLLNAGHGYTAGINISFDLATLQGFDGIFLAGNLLDDTQINTLKEYVRRGGNVYLAGGTSTGSSVPDSWNRFLNDSNLAFRRSVNGIGGNINVTSASHPIFDGVTRLYQNNGNSISGDGVEVLFNGQGLYAVVEYIRD